MSRHVEFFSPSLKVEGRVAKLDIANAEMDFNIKLDPGNLLAGVHQDVGYDLGSLASRVEATLEQPSTWAPPDRRRSIV